MSRTKIAGILCCCGVLWSSPQASAITINLVYRDVGQTISGYGPADSAPTNTTGTGSLRSVFEAAASVWEAALLDDFTYTLQYGWYPRNSGILATHSLRSQGGVPNRETSAAIVFDSDNSSTFFLDPTPHNASEFGTYTEYTQDLGGGSMNVGRVYRNGTGPASRTDLFSVALHEIGHSLGLSSSNISYRNETGGDNDVDVGSPLPFAGSQIPTNNSGSSFNAHIDLPYASMGTSIASGRREHLSAADILANAQISQFFSVNLNPTVPEPTTATLGIMLVSCVGFARRSASRRRS